MSNEPLFRRGDEVMRALPEGVDNRLIAPYVRRMITDAVEVGRVVGAQSDRSADEFARMLAVAVEDTICEAADATYERRLNT